MKGDDNWCRTTIALRPDAMAALRAAAKERQNQTGRRSVSSLVEEWVRREIMGGKPYEEEEDAT